MNITISKKENNINFKPPLLITDVAIEKFFEFFNNNPDDQYLFLISVKEGKGCGGNEYDLQPIKNTSYNQKLHELFFYNYQEKKYLSNKIFTIEEAQEKKFLIFAVDKFSLFKLIGSTIDFSEKDRFTKGFIFINPNESGRCGCGKSFVI